MIGVTVLGSTGSVGESTLDVLARHPQRFRLVAIAAHRNAAKLARQVLEWQPAYAALADEAAARELAALLGGSAPNTRVLAGAGALEELARGLDQLGLDGVVLMTNALGHYLGDPLYRPLFDELQRRAALVFIHPTMSPDPSAHSLGIPDSLLDFPVDTSRTVAQMHYSGTFARTPDVKYVLSHAGGTVPYLAKRFAIIDEMGVVPDEDGTRGTAADTFRRLYFDTALSWSDPTLHTLREVVGLDHVLYGSDYPYLRRDIAMRGRAELDASRELSDVERVAVLHGAAIGLLPRLAAHRRLTDGPEHGARAVAQGRGGH